MLSEERQEELRQVALDLYKGQIFTSEHIRESEVERMLPIVFMVLGFMEKAELEAMSERDVVVFYEYYSQAGPRSINGYPMFTSCYQLTREEWAFVVRGHNKIKKQMERLGFDKEINHAE